jgi:hypothetical protein
MDDTTRRALIRGTGVALATGLAGCSGLGSSGNAESTPTPEPAGVTFSAAVLRQSSEDGPARIEVTLANGSDAPIELGFKPALYAGFQSRVNDVRLRPVADVGEYPEPSYENDCWTMPSETVSRVTGTEYRALDPGAEYTEQYDLFTIAGSGDCLPDGSYAITTEADVRGTQDRLSLTLRFTLGEDGTVEVGDATQATVT